MKYIRKFICIVIGHNDTVVVTGKNEFSVWGWYRCSRCERIEAFQFDG